MNCCKKSFTLCEPAPSCLTQLIVKTPIISDDLTIKFIDKFNRVYTVDKTSDANGKVTLQLQEDDSDINNIIVADLPIALLNEYAGSFKILIYNTSNNIVQWTIAGAQYDALAIDIANITPVVDDYTIDPTYADGIAGVFNL